MTPRERIIAAFTHQTPDHTPTDGWFHQEVRERLLKHYQTAEWSEVLSNLGIEGWAHCGPWLSFPEYETKVTARPGGRDGKKAIWLDDRTYEDAWGVRHRYGKDDWYEEWVGGPLEEAETADDIHQYHFPTAAQIVEPEDYSRKVQELKEQDLFVQAGIPNPYKQAWYLRGMDNILADYLINPEVLEAVYDRLYELYTEMALRMAKANVDMITVTGDIAMQDRIIMGPDSWRKFDKPRLAALIEACKAVNPDLYMFIHSDGNVMDLMDDIVEIGFDIVNPIQPECMDAAEVKRRWGDRITLHGGISLQQTLPNGTVGEVRAEVEDLIEACGRDGGLVVFPSNVIQPDTPTENIIACYHAARDFKL